MYFSYVVAIPIFEILKMKAPSGFFQKNTLINGAYALA